MHNNQLTIRYASYWCMPNVYQYASLYSVLMLLCDLNDQKNDDIWDGVKLLGVL